MPSCVVIINRHRLATAADVPYSQANMYIRPGSTLASQEYPSVQIRQFCHDT